MVVSFHPCFVADRNRICAGRSPDDRDFAVIRQAKAVVLPQGCPRQLYEMVRTAAVPAFPDYGVRFGYPGKTGQIRLFRTQGAAFPQTLCFSDVADLNRRHPGWHHAPPLALPLVFKFDWGGQGESVFLVQTMATLQTLVDRAAAQEVSGYRGFLMQQWIPTANRCLRVAVIGRHIQSYWRIQDDPTRFQANLANGGRIDANGDPILQDTAVRHVRDLCRATGINLAGFDLIFSAGATDTEPLFLEINWFFGRRGLGGSERFYRLLVREINGWLSGMGLAPGHG